MSPTPEQARYVTDDCDLDAAELVIRPGGNGDWYIGVCSGEHNRTPEYAVRISTHGTKTPGVAAAVNALYEAILGRGLSAPSAAAVPSFDYEEFNRLAEAKDAAAQPKAPSVKEKLAGCTDGVKQIHERFVARLASSSYLDSQEAADMAALLDLLLDQPKAPSQSDEINKAIADVEAEDWEYEYGDPPLGIVARVPKQPAPGPTPAEVARASPSSVNGSTSCRPTKPCRRFLESKLAPPAY